MYAKATQWRCVKAGVSDGNPSKPETGGRILTMPIPSMAKTTVVKNMGMCDKGAIHGRDPMSDNGTVAALASGPANGLTPVITHIMVHPRPTSIQVVAMAEKGTKSRRVRRIPSGKSGNARTRIQMRMDMCHSGGKCVSATWKIVRILAGKSNSSPSQTLVRCVPVLLTPI